jgi:peptide/nickel transport system permease protein
MFAVIIQRLAVLIPLLLLISFAVSALVVLTPGDPAYAILGENATPEAVEALREKLGLNEPFLLRYVLWLTAVLQGDLGNSLLNNVPVAEAIFDRLPVTASLVGAAFVLSIVLGLPAGMLAGYWQRGRFDRGATVTASLAIAAPEFWISMLLIFLFGLQLGWLPSVGYVPFSQSPALYFQHLILPVIALSIPGAGELFRQARAAAADTSRQDFVRTSKASGLPERRVLVRHVAKNAMIPVVTVAGLQLGRLIGLAAVTETVFGMQGVGSLAVLAALNSDLPVIQGVVLITASIVLLSNFVVDVSYYYFNPRLRSS